MNAEALVLELIAIVIAIYVAYNDPLLFLFMVLLVLGMIEPQKLPKVARALGYFYYKYVKKPLDELNKLLREFFAKIVLWRYERLRGT